MIVMKFGGTSVESRVALERLIEIVRTTTGSRLVVVSAMGKTTNRLLEMAEVARRGERAEAEALLASLERDTKGEAFCSNDSVEQLFLELRELLRGLAIVQELTPRTIDLVASFGERISSLIVADALSHAGLPAKQVDARKLLITDNRFTHAAPNIEATNARCREYLLPLLEREIVVVGGFIGGTLTGETTTLGRGGSDYSAALFGAALQASEIQIWTDVDGMLTCDPRILPGGKRIRRISFHEAAELAYFGAKVLHPSTVLPAIEGNIPVRVLNSKNPGSDGTLITAERVQTSNIFKSIACKRGITTLHIHSTRMLMAHGFLKGIFEIFDRFETPVDLIATSEVSVSVTIDSPKRLPEIVQHLELIADLSVEEEQAIVSLVGEGLQTRTGVLAEVFSAIREYPVRMVSQGASDLNISFVVSNSALQPVLGALHGKFFATGDTSVFA